MQLSTFLRTVLKLDAASCLGMAAILIPGASALEPLLGVPAALLSGAGYSLVLVGLFVLWLGTRADAMAALVWVVIAGNLGWAVASFATAFELPAITALGTAFVALQGAIVLILALLEWGGLRASLRELRRA